MEFLAFKGNYPSDKPYSTLEYPIVMIVWKDDEERLKFIENVSNMQPQEGQRVYCEFDKTEFRPDIIQGLMEKLRMENIY